MKHICGVYFGQILAEKYPKIHVKKPATHAFRKQKAIYLQLDKKGLHHITDLHPASRLEETSLQIFFYDFHSNFQRSYFEEQL